MVVVYIEGEERRRKKYRAQVLAYVPEGQAKECGLEVRFDGKQGKYWIDEESEDEWDWEVQPMPLPPRPHDMLPVLVQSWLQQDLTTVHTT